MIVEMHASGSSFLVATDNGRDVLRNVRYLKKIADTGKSAILSVYKNTNGGALRAVNAATSLPGADAAPVRGNTKGHTWGSGNAEFLGLSGSSYFLAKAEIQAKAEREAEAPVTAAAAAAKAAGNKPANSIRNNGLTFEWVDSNNLHQQIEGHPYKMGIYVAGVIIAVALIVSLFTCCCCVKGCSTMGSCFTAPFRCLGNVCKGKKKGKEQGSTFY